MVQALLIPQGPLFSVLLWGWKAISSIQRIPSVGENLLQWKLRTYLCWKLQQPFLNCWYESSPSLEQKYGIPFFKESLSGQQWLCRLSHQLWLDMLQETLVTKMGEDLRPSILLPLDTVPNGEFWGSSQEKRCISRRVFLFLPGIILETVLHGPTHCHPRILAA